MDSTRTKNKKLWAATFSLVTVIVVGCAGKPLWLDVVALNPMVREKWAADEQLGPTFYAKRDELRAVRESIPLMTAEQQERLVSQLSEVLQQEENDLLRREAVLTLGYTSTASAVPALRAALSDPEADVRGGACQAWAQRGGRDAATALAQVIGSDQDADVRITAVSELRRFRGPVVLQALSLALDDNDPALQYAAVQSLREVGDSDYGNSVYAWREYLRGNNPPVPRPSLVERLGNWF